MRGEGPILSRCDTISGTICVAWGSCILRRREHPPSERWSEYIVYSGVSAEGSVRIERGVGGVEGMWVCRLNICHIA